MKPQIGYPKVFSQGFNTLIDVITENLDSEGDTLSSINWLIKRSLIKVSYPTPGMRKIKPTKRATDFINAVMESDFQEAAMHEGGIFVAILLIHFKKKENYSHLNVKNEKYKKIINRLKFLKFIDGENLTEKGEAFLNLYYDKFLVQLILNTDMLDSIGDPYVWWVDWLVNNAPLDGWAVVLVDLEIPENIKNLYHEKLIPKFDLL